MAGMTITIIELVNGQQMIFVNCSLLPNDCICRILIIIIIRSIFCDQRIKAMRLISARAALAGKRKINRKKNQKETAQRISNLKSKPMVKKNENRENVDPNISGSTRERSSRIEAKEPKIIGYNSAGKPYFENGRKDTVENYNIFNLELINKQIAVIEKHARSKCNGNLSLNPTPLSDFSLRHLSGQFFSVYEMCCTECTERFFF